MHPAPGHWVTDRIELVAPIGEGAMGKVWRAKHHGLHTEVAVKFVSTDLGDDQGEALARFRLEARVAAQIKSPHVVQTFDSGITEAGTPFIVMELLEGESLGDRIRRGPIGMAEAAMVLRQVGKALDAAHDVGVVHRDVKPDNIFLTNTEDGLFCKVLDFGIAKQTRLPEMGGLTTDGKMVGTPEFMSPEQVLETAEVTPRADRWALAVSMYVGLTGTLPFTGATLGQLCLNLVNNPPPPPSSLRADLSPAVDGWFARALARDPEIRFGSGRDMAAAFLSAEDAPLTEWTEDRLHPAPRPGWQAPLAAGAVVLSLGLVGGAGVFLTGGGTSAPAAAADEPVPAAVTPEPKLEPSPVIDLDDDAPIVDDEPEPAVSASTGDEARPHRAPPRRRAAPSPPPPPPPPPPPSTSKKRRDESDLGF